MTQSTFHVNRNVDPFNAKKVFGQAWLCAGALVLSIWIGFDPAAAAGALPIDDATRCSVMNQVMDAEDDDGIAQIAMFIGHIWSDVDNAYFTRGGGPIISKLSLKGYQSMLAATSVHCREYVDITIKHSALFVYEGIQGVQEDLGILRRVPHIYPGWDK